MRVSNQRSRLSPLFPVRTTSCHTVPLRSRAHLALLSVPPSLLPFFHLPSLPPSMTPKTHLLPPFPSPPCLPLLLLVPRLSPLPLPAPRLTTGAVRALLLVVMVVVPRGAALEGGGGEGGEEGGAGWRGVVVSPVARPLVLGLLVLPEAGIILGALFVYVWLDGVGCEVCV